MDWVGEGGSLDLFVPLLNVAILIASLFIYYVRCEFASLIGLLRLIAQRWLMRD